MQTKVEAVNVTGSGNLIVRDLVDAVLPGTFPQTKVLLSEKNSYDKILSSVELRSLVVATSVFLVVNDYQLGKEESLEFLDKTKFVSKYRPITVAFADSPYTAQEGDFILIDATSGDVLISLPPALATRGNDIMAQRIDDTSSGFFVEISGDLGETINYQASIRLKSQFEVATITSAASEWFSKSANKAPWDVVSIAFADSPYSAVIGEYIEADPTGGDTVVQLPDATTCKGFEIKVKKLTASANKVIPTAQFPQLVEGVASIDMVVQNLCYTFTSNGTGWSIT